MELDLPKLEQEILKKWEAEKTFEKSVARRKGSRRFVFYEGPPTANAGPGLHHVLGRVFKDIILRYKTMRGFFVPRRAGWDTHGLPVELQIEKKLGLKSKKEIEQYGIAKFNAECKQSVWEFKKDWENLTERIGFWIDMQNPYITYETSYIEILWSIIEQFWQKKLLYKDYKVVPFCPRCGTALSSHELAQGYKTITDQSVYVKFKLKSGQKIGNSFVTNDKTYILSWTTTPWTLPGNVALAINPKEDYVRLDIKSSESSFVKSGESFLLMDGDPLRRVFGLAVPLEGSGFEGPFSLDVPDGKNVLVYKKIVKGTELLGLQYNPLFDVRVLQNEKSHKIYAADFVTATDGTGVVHTAVMYGEDDYKLGEKVGLPQHHTVDERGRFKSEVPGLADLEVKAKETEDKIFAYLKERNAFLKTEPYEHEYPFCWRCSTPLLYYAKDSWFINMQRIKKELLANNEKINWIPKHIKEGRMGEWLKEVKDWAFSRERYWGTPLPVWQCQNCKHIETVGSVKELSQKQTNNNLFFVMRHGYSERQITNTMSCWPEKSSLPLTPKGIRQALKVAKELGKKKIDLIFSSDILRAKQTAEIVGAELGIKPEFDERLREWNVGELNGQPIEKLGEIWGKLNETSEEHYLRRFVDPMPGGESYVDLQKRMYEFVQDINSKYKNKNILIVSHEIPLTLLETTILGLSRKEAVEFRQNKKRFLNTGEWRKLSYAQFPFNEGMEIDLHRPFVDDVVFLCSACKKGKMKRVKEVVDVWFDSGAMPFASKSPFPADYIVEGIDQTRGWFYTLLAVSTLLGFKTPYKNVITLSHVLDPKGEKMSKSKGNAVDPFLIIQKYGADPVRWYFYTVNNPGDPKLFSEKDIQGATRNFLLTFWNCFVFYKTYAGKLQTKNYKLKTAKHVLDKWILSRLNGTIKEVRQKLDSYDVTGAGRAVQDFVVNDLSLWYIRRSRSRTKEAGPTLGFVLSEVCKLLAPFIPFLSEHIFQNLGGKGSVHWQNFPKAKAISSKLETQMVWIRDVVAKALAERAKAGIKVRQPLTSLKIQNPKSLAGQAKIQNDLLELIKDEVNVKQVLFKAGLRAEVELDTKITPELKEEGILREINRQIQGLRKEAGFRPIEKTEVFCAGNPELCTLIERIVSTAIKALKLEEPTPQTTDAMKEIDIDGTKLRLGVKKI